MRAKFLLFFFWGNLCLFSQELITIDDHGIDSRQSNSFFSPIYLNSTNVNSIAEHFEQKLPNLSYSTLRHIHTIESKTQKHSTFLQYVNNTPVFRGELKVSYLPEGKVLSLFDNTFPFTHSVPGTFPEIDNIRNKLVGIGAKINKVYHVYFPVKEALHPAVYINYDKGRNNIEQVLGTDQKIYYQNTCNSYFAPIDSTISALVFNPDPLTTAGVTYGTPYVDSNDIDVVVLNAERVSVNFDVKYSGDTFYLKNDYVNIIEFDPPNVPPVYSVASPNFNYTRAQSGFEDVNAAYHITTFQKYIQSLGFNNLCNFPIEVDAHAMNGSDNSQFVPSTQRLYFGEGGVDDAEDADVIIHEYGHAISYSASPNTNNGIERKAIDEGLGDYLAGSYSRSIDPFRWDDVFSWDGHNQFWGGRSVNTAKLYPGGLIGNIYSDAEIWSSTLMEIWSDIGKNKCDEILLESIYGYANNMTMVDAANLFVKADSTLYNGQHYTNICNRFKNRGIFNICVVGVDEKEEFPGFYFDEYSFRELHELKLNFNSPFTGTAQIFDALGREVFNLPLENVQSVQRSFEGNSTALYYILLRSSNHSSVSIKALQQ